MPHRTVDKKKITLIYDTGDGLAFTFSSAEKIKQRIHLAVLNNGFAICIEKNGKTSEPISVLPQDQFYYISVEVQSCLKKPILFFPQP